MSRLKSLFVAGTLAVAGCGAWGTRVPPAFDPTAQTASQDGRFAKIDPGAGRELSGDTAGNPPAKPGAGDLDEARLQVLSFIQRLDTAPDDDQPASAAGERRNTSLPPATEHPGPSQPAGAARTHTLKDGSHEAASPSPAMTANAPSELDRAALRRPPRVLSVSVRSAPAPGKASPAREARDGPGLAVETGVANRGVVEPDPAAGESLDALASRLEREAAAAPGDAAVQWRVALMRLAMGVEEAPTMSFSGLTETSSDLLATTVRAISATGRALSDPVNATDPALEAVEALRGRLRERASLRIGTVALCSRVQAYGLFDVLPATAFQPGASNQAIVYFDVENFMSEAAENNQRRTRLSERLEVLTADGDVVWQVEESTIEDLCNRQREDFFVAQRIVLPVHLERGEYVLKITVQDLLADKRTQALHPFRIGSAVN